MIAFTDGKYIGATLDRNGLRPSRYYVTKDDLIYLSSEVGVVPELPEANIRFKSRLEPGKMFLVDFDKGEIISDNIIKEEIAQARDYSKWLNENLFSIKDWVKASKPKVPAFNFEDTNRRLNMFGYSVETLDILLYPMGKILLSLGGANLPCPPFSRQGSVERKRWVRWAMMPLWQ